MHRRIIKKISWVGLSLVMASMLAIDPLAGTYNRPAGYTPLGRSLVAFPQASNAVHLSWRLFQEDLDALVQFKVFRQTSPGACNTGTDITPSFINPATQPTALTDTPGAGTYTYRVCAYGSGNLNNLITEPIGGDQVTITTSSNGRNYLALDLGCQYHTDWAKVSVAAGDLEGNGSMGYAVAFQPNVSGCMVNGTTLNTTDYYIEAFKTDPASPTGTTRLWGPIDIGPAPDGGVPTTQGVSFHQPVVIWDICSGANCSGAPDGRAEVIARTNTGAGAWNDYCNEKLTVFDGLTGNILNQIPFPEGSCPPCPNPPCPVSQACSSYCDRSANWLAIAYLSGTNPSVIAARGLHNATRVSRVAGEGCPSPAP
jgi:hypothetical protein